MDPAGRSAHLRLQGGDVGARVMWPAALPGGTMILLVDADDAAHGDYICRYLSERLGVVTLRAACSGLDDGATAIEWTADHAAELGAGGTRLLLAGLHATAAVTVALALRARDNGWPDVARQVLIHPRGTVPPGLAGVAPATVVGSRAHAALLRQAGVDVDELDDVDPFRRRHGSADRMLALLASRLG